MRIADYQNLAETTDKIAQYGIQDRSVYYLGAIGELGTFLSEIKKSIRDGDSYSGYKENISEELGDMFWYIARLASLQNIELENCAKIAKERNLEVDEPTFSLVQSVVGLVELLRTNGRLTENEFVKLFTSLESVCAEEQITLEDVLERNSDKIIDNWAGDISAPATTFDGDYPQHERLPRHLQVEFFEVSRGNATEVLQRIEGIAVGDRLTDNAHDPDDYRYHDVFHLSYLACLGWSPVIRRMLRAKRKSNGRVDEVEDGARAAIIEEAVASLVFDYARDHTWLAGVDRVDHGLLKQIRNMVRGLEIQSAGSWEWQHAILMGFSVFRELKINRGGWVLVDSERRILEYRVSI